MWILSASNKYWLFVAGAVLATLVTIAAIGAFCWQGLSPAEQTLLLKLLKENVEYLFAAAVFMLAALGFGLDGIFHNYIIPLSKLPEELGVITSVNPSHRISPDGGKDMVRLAERINTMAEGFENLLDEVESRIHRAKAAVEDEKNILAAFMAELPEGVLICNAQGEILLYNRRAREFLADESEECAFDPGSHRFIGLCRSVFDLVDRNLIIHALDEINIKLWQDQSHAASHFVFQGRDDRLLRAEVVPVLDREKKFNGFILILYDIAQEIEAARQLDGLLQSLTTGIRRSVAGVRLAIELLQEFPDLSQTDQKKFMAIIHEQSIRIGELLDQSAQDYSGLLQTRWPRIPMADEDLARMIKKRAHDRLGVVLSLHAEGKKRWIQVDSYSVILGFLFMIKRLKKFTELKKFSLELFRKEDFVNLDLRWQGEPVGTDLLGKWQSEPLRVEGESVPLSLREVLRYHDGELWSYSDRNPHPFARIKVLLPVLKSDPQTGRREIMILPESRPEFYDFDLFKRPEQRTDLDNCRLSELSYTVFDTETTGLNPREGDEIVSVAAVRIVNGQLLKEEYFDQLVNPRRTVPAESVKYHGIDPSILTDQPGIEKVLPMFHCFAKNTVLVAHNAAFDMLLLELKEQATGVKFSNPVLDTLLLSAVVHPNQQKHNLEDIADRLGIPVVGRHTALGDAICTAEVFLKQVRLLADRGIYTLKQARLASEKTYYARLRY